MQKNTIWWSLALVILVGGGLAVYNSRPATMDLAKEDSPPASESSDTATPAQDGTRLIGGVNRPSADVRDLATAQSANQQQANFLKPEGGHPKVAIDANEQVTQVAEAIKSGEHPERTSSLIVPHSFDRSEFEKDPAGYAKAYASVVEPGRVFAPAQPAEGVKALTAQGERYHRVTQGETVRLIASAKPNAPVTFTSFGFGQFSNQLTSITVVADGEGLATAPFTASSGTKNSVDVLAASPVLSEQVKYVIAVQLP